MSIKQYYSLRNRNKNYMYLIWDEAEGGGWGSAVDLFS